MAFFHRFPSSQEWDEPLETAKAFFFVVVLMCFLGESVWVKQITTSLFSLTGNHGFYFRGIIPKWPKYSG